MLVLTCLPLTSSLAKENLPPLVQQQSEQHLLKSAALGRMDACVESGACDRAAEPQC